MGNKQSGSLSESSDGRTLLPGIAHMARLWAEVYRVAQTKDSPLELESPPHVATKWEKFTEEAVPVNVAVSYQGTVATVRLTAYNSHIEKICDIEFVQPGTALYRASECFVQWIDPNARELWGLNFSEKEDAALFQETCMAITKKLLSKSSSLGTFRLRNLARWAKPKTLKGTTGLEKGSNKGVPNSFSEDGISSGRVKRPNETGDATLPRFRKQRNDSRDLFSLRPSESRQQRSSYPAAIDEKELSPAHSPTRNLSAFHQQRGPVQCLTEKRRRGSPERASDTFNRLFTPRDEAGAALVGQGNSGLSRDISNRIGKDQNYSISGDSHPGVGHPGDSHPGDSHPRDSHSGDNQPGDNHPDEYNTHDELIHNSLQAAPVTCEAVPAPVHVGLLESARPSQFDLSRVSSELQPVTQATAPSSDHSKSFSQDGGQGYPVTEVTDALCHSEDEHSLDGEKPSDWEAAINESCNRLSEQKANSNWPQPPSGLKPSADFLTMSGQEKELQARFGSGTLKRLLRSLPGGSSSSSAGNARRQDSRDGDDCAFADSVNGKSSGGTLRRRSEKRSTGSNSGENCDKYRICDPRDTAQTNDSIHTHNAKGGDEALNREYSDSGFGGTAYSENTESVVSGSISASSVSGKTRQGWTKVFRRSPHDHDNISSAVSNGAGGSNEGEYQENTDSKNKRAGSEDSLTQSDEDLCGAGVSEEDELEMTQVCPFTLESDEDSEEDACKDDKARDESLESDSFGKDEVCDDKLKLAGTTRKAGWLRIKHWLTSRHQRLQLAARRRWHRYWAVLRGSNLFLYEGGEGAEPTPPPSLGAEPDGSEVRPKHCISLGSSLAQAVPEHRKRDHIFALSCASGEAYLLEAPSQVEHDSWVQTIHSACGSLVARGLRKTNTVKALQSEILQWDDRISEDEKMKNMGQLQLTTEKEAKTREVISQKTASWERDLESLHIAQYLRRCYLHSALGTEQPNPKPLLSAMSTRTKASLRKLGVLNATSFHALTSARRAQEGSLERSDVTLRPRRGRDTVDGRMTWSKRFFSSIYDKGQSTKSRLGIGSSSSLWTGGEEGRRQSGMLGRGTVGSVPSVSDRLEDVYPEGERGGDSEEEDSDESPSPRSLAGDDADDFVQVNMPGGEVVVSVPVLEDMTVQELLEWACQARRLNHVSYYIQMESKATLSFCPAKGKLVRKLRYDSVSVLQKTIFQTILSRSPEGGDNLGLSVEGELVDNCESEDEVQVYISSVDEGSPAELASLMVGDEIVAVNGLVCPHLDIDGVERLMEEEEELCVTVRSCRQDKPHEELSFQKSHADAYIDNMMCPPPPEQSRITEDTITNLIVPPPHWVEDDVKTEEIRTIKRTPANKRMRADSVQVHNLLETAGQVSLQVRLAKEEVFSTDVGSVHVKKLRQVLYELVRTERYYIRDLTHLLQRYLDPLKEEQFLAGPDSEEVAHLRASTRAILTAQEAFLASLELAVKDRELYLYSTPEDFKDSLLAVAESFSQHSGFFKLYVSYCASHSRAQKILTSGGGSSALHDFLTARNPQKQHSASLESYLIKPIQRLLKYPLLIEQLLRLAPPNSEEFLSLQRARETITLKAAIMNDMQHIAEKFGVSLDTLTKTRRRELLQTSGGHHRGRLELDLAELRHYGKVKWKGSRGVGRERELDDGEAEGDRPLKGFEWGTWLFVFRGGVALVCREEAVEKNQKRKGKKPLLVDPEVRVKSQLFVPVRYLELLDGGIPAHHFSLTHRKFGERRSPKTYFFEAGSEHQKTEFTKTIKEILTERASRTSAEARDGQEASEVSHSSQPSLDETDAGSLGAPGEDTASVSSSGTKSSSLTTSSSDKMLRRLNSFPAVGHNGGLEHEAVGNVEFRRNSENMFNGLDPSLLRDESSMTSKPRPVTVKFDFPGYVQ